MKKENNNVENKYADVPLRVKTWAYIIFVFTLAISHPIAMKVFISWIGFQVFFEFIRMFKIQTKPIIVSLAIAIPQFFLLFFLNLKQYTFYVLLLLVAMLLFFVSKKSSLKQMYGVGIGLLLSLLVFPYLVFVREGIWGVKALVFLVVVTELNDVFQYLMGKSLGKHKIMPKISPNKTWAGVIGGVSLTIILSNILGYFLLPSTMIMNTVFGLVLGVLGFLGDVFMSSIKRKTNVKDTGKLLPGHGGLLDRMDSLTFNAPVFFWMFSLLLKG